jgi:hypothetical protein
VTKANQRGSSRESLKIRQISPSFLGVMQKTSPLRETVIWLPADKLAIQAQKIWGISL